MKTNEIDKSFENNVRQKYKNDKKHGFLRGDLRKLTPGSLKFICLNLLDENLSIEDKKTLSKFFELRKDEDLFIKIKKYDIDGFRPICKFLKGKTETIHQHYAIELIAIIINFYPRPSNKYYTSELNKGSIITKRTETIDDAVNYITKDDKKPDIIVKPKNKKLFAWFSSVSAMNSTLLKTGIIATIIISIIVFKVSTKKDPNWMVWKGDHYEEVTFDLDKYDFNQLKLYKLDRIFNFKQITANCGTKFFKDDGSENIWYGKNANGELEYFTNLGLHPDTGKTLKKITTHMIKTHICDDYKQ